MPKEPDEIVYVYEPAEGLFVTGVPARDLTQADVDQLGAGRVAHAVSTGLYRKASKTEKEQAAKSAENVAEHIATEQPVATGEGAK